MLHKVLFVDDDINLLESYKRQFYKEFSITLAQGSAEGLEAIENSETPFAVIVADLCMPGMDGIQFLSLVRELSPDTVRIMLTGNVDVQTTVDAVNHGNIFRFLTKPCQSNQLVKALRAGVEQHHLVIAERELLEQTLRGSVRVLTEILSVANPTAFGWSSRIKRYVSHMAKVLGLDDIWQYELAAMLSQIGCVSLPPDLVEKIYSGKGGLTPAEKRMYVDHPVVGCKLLENIPRMAVIAGMISNQQSHFKSRPDDEDNYQLDNIEVLGGQMLKLALDFDQFYAGSMSHEKALTQLRQREDVYNPILLDALSSLPLDPEDIQIVEATVRDLKIGMVTDQNVYSHNGLMLVSKGHEITYAILERLKNCSAHGGVGVREPFLVRMRAADAALVGV